MRITLRFAAAAVLTAALCVPSLALAQTSTPPDVVRLRDGTFLRGTLVERSPTRVVVLLQTGETRTYPADAVEFAGPEAPAPLPTSVPVVAEAAQIPVAIPVAATRTGAARVHVRSDQPGLSLQRLQGTDTVIVQTGNSVGMAYIDQFSVLCNAPCDTEIVEGTYQLGVALEDNRAVRAGAPILLSGDTTLDLRYDDQSGTRLAGWITLIGGNVLGAGLLVVSFSAGSEDCSSGSCRSTLSVPLMIGGAVIAIGASLVSLFLITRSDSAEVEVLTNARRF